jgi:hypothetical protein
MATATAIVRYYCLRENAGRYFGFVLLSNAPSLIIPAFHPAPTGVLMRSPCGGGGRRPVGQIPTCIIAIPDSTIRSMFARALAAATDNDEHDRQGPLIGADDIIRAQALIFPMAERTVIVIVEERRVYVPPTSSSQHFGALQLSQKRKYLWWGNSRVSQ